MFPAFAISVSVNCAFHASSPALGAKAKIDFLVREGQIRAEAVVPHFVSGGGLGLKFTKITAKDCPQQDSHFAVYREGPFTSSAIPGSTAQAAGGGESEGCPR